MGKGSAKQWQHVDDEERKNLPPCMNFVNKLFSPDDARIGLSNAGVQYGIVPRDSQCWPILYLTYPEQRLLSAKLPTINLR
jgi:hypothetical protein